MPLPFQLPDFNITVNIWRAANPTTNPPDVVSPAQFYLNARIVLTIGFTGAGEVIINSELRVPKGTDLQLDDVVEIDAGSGLFYTVIFADRVHFGFPNEYFMGVVSKGGSPVPPAGTAILMEGGDASSEISGMPAAADVSLTDLFVIVDSGGTNQQCTKQQILTAAAGEDELLTGGSGDVGFQDSTSLRSFRMNSSGDCLAEVTNIFWRDPFATKFVWGVDSSGNYSFTCLTAGGNFNAVIGTNCQFLLDDSAGVFNLIAPNGGNVTYKALIPALWQTADPLYYQDAIDRIARQVKILIGGPIP